MAQVGRPLRELRFDFLEAPHGGIALVRELLDRGDDAPELGLRLIASSALVREFLDGLRDLLGSTRERDLGTAGTILGPGESSLRLALDALLVNRVVLLLLLLAQLVEPGLPPVWAREPQPARFTDCVLCEVTGDPLAEGVVFLDDTAGDVERRSGQSREAEVALQLRGCRLGRLSRLAFARNFHHCFDRRLEQGRRRAHGTVSSSSCSTRPPVPHQRQVISSTVSDNTSSSSTVRSPPTV